MALLAITRCLLTTSTAELQVLAGTLPLDLQVEKEYFLGRILRLVENGNIDGVHITANTIQRKAEHWRVHLARTPFID